MSVRILIPAAVAVHALFAHVAAEVRAAAYAAAIARVAFVAITP